MLLDPYVFFLLHLGVPPMFVVQIAMVFLLWTS